MFEHPHSLSIIPQVPGTSQAPHIRPDRLCPGARQYYVPYSTSFISSCSSGRSITFPATRKPDRITCAPVVQARQSLESLALFRVEPHCYPLRSIDFSFFLLYIQCVTFGASFLRVASVAAGDLFFVRSHHKPETVRPSRADAFLHIAHPALFDSAVWQGTRSTASAPAPPVTHQGRSPSCQILCQVCRR